MDNSNNYINENENLRNLLFNLLMGRPININIIDLSSNNTENTENIDNIDLSNNTHTNSIDTEYMNFFRNYYRSSYLRRNNSNFESILQQSLMDPSQNLYKNVLSDEGESNIKTVIFTKNKYKNDSCPISLMDFKQGDEVSQLPCGHIFMKDAVMKWLKDENASCPVCRKPLASKEVKKEIKNRNVVLNATNSNTVINRYPMHDSNFRRQFVQNYIERQIERQEQAEIQAAIIASLRDQNN